jgi:hypothetical protein
MPPCELTLAYLRILASEDSIVLDPTDAKDLADIFALDHYARQMRGDPVERLRDPFLHPSLVYKGVTFKRLSIGMRDWIQSVCDRWYGEDRSMHNASVVYCLAHSEAPEFAWSFEADQAGWTKVIKGWMRVCKIGPEDLDCIIMALYPPMGPDEAKANDRAQNYGPVIEMLVREYGETPEYWIWTATDAQVETLVTRYLERIDAQEQAAAEAAGPKGARINPDGLKQERRKQFFACVDKIKARKKPQ